MLLLGGGDLFINEEDLGVSYTPMSPILRLRGTYTSPTSGRDNLLEEPPVTPETVRSLRAESGNWSKVAYSARVYFELFDVKVFRKDWWWTLVDGVFLEAYLGDHLLVTMLLKSIWYLGEALRIKDATLGYLGGLYLPGDHSRIVSNCYLLVGFTFPRVDDID